MRLKYRLLVYGEPELVNSYLSKAFNKIGREIGSHRKWELEVKLLDEFCDYELITTCIKLGLAYLHKKDYDRAIINFQKVIDLNPKDIYKLFEVWTLLGEAYKDKGVLNKAKACFKKFEEIRKKYYEIK